MRTLVALLGVAMLAGHGAPANTGARAPLRGDHGAVRHSTDGDARSFLAAARGVDPVICSLAAAPVGNGWGDTGAPRADAGAALIGWALKPSLDRRDLTVLGEGLRDTDDCVRTMAARLLGAIEGGAPVLVDALGDANPGIRRAAAEGLGFAELASTVRPLAARLEDDRDVNVRAAAAWALGRTEHPSAEAALARALHDSEPSVRRAAVDALGELELESSIDVLLPMLDDADARTRAAAARALGRLD